MIKNIFLTTYLLLAFSCFAQDTLVKQSNEKIIAKVLEVNQQEIKYKLFSFLDGPTYIISKVEVKSIRYSNGSNEIYNLTAPHPSTNNKPLNNMQPKDGYWYYYNEKVISEPVMLETAEKIKDPKIHHFIKKTRSYVALKQGAKVTGVALGIGSLLVLTGIVNFSNTASLAATANTRGGPRSASNNTRQVLQTTRRSNAGKVFLGALGASVLSISFKFGEKKNAHLVCDLFNLQSYSNDYSH